MTTAGLPKLPIFPYLSAPIPEWFYRFDTRAPEEIFKDGFYAWAAEWTCAGTWPVSPITSAPPVS